jgi:hypothetical protein
MPPILPYPLGLAVFVPGWLALQAAGCWQFQLQRVRVCMHAWPAIRTDRVYSLASPVPANGQRREGVCVRVCEQTQDVHLLFCFYFPQPSPFTLYTSCDIDEEPTTG